MSMQVLICPHCKKDSGTVAVNDNLLMSKVHKTCSKCHKRFAWQGNYGTIEIYKE